MVCKNQKLIYCFYISHFSRSSRFPTLPIVALHCFYIFHYSHCSHNNLKNQRFLQLLITSPVKPIYGCNQTNTLRALLFLIHCGRVVRLRLQHCPIKRPTAPRLVAASMPLISPLYASIFHFVAVGCSEHASHFTFVRINLPFCCGWLLRASLLFRFCAYQSSILLLLFAHKLYLSRVFGG